MKVKPLPRVVAPSSCVMIPDLFLGVTIPMEPPSATNPNVAKHWGTKRKARAKFRKAAYDATTAIIAETTPSEVPWFPADATLDIRVTVGWSKGRMRMDGDNLTASCKGMLDGVAEAIGCDDRFFRVHPPEQVRDQFDQGWTRVEVTPGGDRGQT